MVLYLHNRKPNTTAQYALGNAMVYVLGPVHFCLICLAVVQYYLKIWPYLLGARWYWNAFKSILKLHKLFLCTRPEWTEA